MFSKKGPRLLQESSGERSYGATLDPSSTETETKRNVVLTKSAPAVLEPSSDAFRHPKPPNKETLKDSSSPPLNPWRTLATISAPEPSTRVPISSNDQPADHADEQQIMDGQQVDEHLSTCASFIRGYSRAALRVRNSKFIYVFQLLFSIIPISAFVMGVVFSGKCDETEALPVFGALTGIIGVVFTCLWMKISCCDPPISDLLKISFLIIFPTFLIFVLVDVCVFSTMWPTFDPEAFNYCDETFYYYAFYKQIATGVAAALATILYLPTPLQYLC